MGRWAEINLPSMTENDMLEFNDEVLTQETPDLYKQLLDHKQPLPPGKYLRAIKEWGLSKK